MEADPAGRIGGGARWPRTPRCRTRTPAPAADPLAARAATPAAFSAALAAVLAAALTAAGCTGDGAGDGGASTAVDTTDGVVRVRHSGALEPWRLEPLLSLGVSGAATGAPSPEEFGRVESVIADESGRVFVADGIALEIRVFGPDGAFLRTLGRKGGGPAEMDAIHGAFWLPDDTLLVADYGNARLLRLTARGELAGQWPWLRVSGSQRVIFPAGPGELYAYGFRVGEQGGESVWTRFTPAGPADTLAVPLAEPQPGSSVVCRGDGIGFFDNPWGQRLLAVPAPGGERVVAWATEYRLAFIGPTGDTLRLLARDTDRLPLPDSLWTPVETSYREFRDGWRGADCDGFLDRPRHRPVLREIHFDHDGRLLVEHATPEGAAFDLYDTDLRWLATFPAPPDRDPSVPPFLRDRHLYLATRDSLAVQQVRAYRLVEP